MKKRIIKFIKYSLSFLLALFITLNLFIILSGKFYIYKGIVNTYLIGEIGPTIYDINVFPSSILKQSKSSLKSIGIKAQHRLSRKEMELLKALDTKAFLVLKGDTIIYENYWGGHTEEMVSNSFSVAKTIVAVLIGIAIEEGYIESLDDPASLYLSEFGVKDKAKITIRHLLQMASGLDWEESRNPLSDNAESYYGSDLRRLVMGKSIERAPGEMFKYQSINTQLLSYIIESSTEMSLAEYAEIKVWNRIGAEHDAYWSLDKELGDEKAFCCIYATARDYAKIGQLLLNKGVINGEQIIPKWYYDEMVTPQELKTKEGICNYRYGLHIWTYLDPEGKVNYCQGMKGQYIITIPSENLIIIRIGSKKKSRVISRKDTKLVFNSKFKVGHSYDLFEYIALGKTISSKRNYPN